MGGQVVFHHLDTADLQHVVDVLDILRHLVIGLLQLLDILQQVMVGVCHLCHVAACAEDGEQFAVCIAYWGELQLVVELVAFQHPMQRPFILTLIDLRDIHVFEVFHVEVRIPHHLLDGDPLVLDHLQIHA